MTAPRILILSDWDIDAGHAPIPMLLATGAVHHHLVRADKRSKASLICETSECRDVHQLACLLGYGASAVNPYAAFATLDGFVSRGRIEEWREVVDAATAAKNYRAALEKGLLKIMSKMGISTLASYSGAQTFQRHRPASRRDRLRLYRHDLAGQGHEFPRDRRGDAGAPHARLCARREAHRRGHLPLPPRRRTARLDAARAAKLPHFRRHQGRGQGGQVGGLREVRRRGRGSRAGRAAPVPRAEEGRRRFRSRKSSRSRTSAAASPPRACRSARSRPRPTKRWPSP